MLDPPDLEALCLSMGIPTRELGIVVVDHGSRREASNRTLLDVVDAFRRATNFALVEPAHMEIAVPSIDTAFERLVAKGARVIIVHPYFLLPGRHWAHDVPALAAAAAQRWGVRHLVSAPLGVHPLMANIMTDRIVRCLQHVVQGAESCDLCESIGKCHEGWSQHSPPPLARENESPSVQPE